MRTTIMAWKDGKYQQVEVSVDLHNEENIWHMKIDGLSFDVTDLNDALHHHGLILKEK